MDVAKTAPDALRILWKDSVFQKPLRLKDIEIELGKRGYNFKDKNLMMALKTSRFLTRKGSAGDYSYVQKHPYIEESNGKRQ